MANRLAGETSPYLLQHADNPVDWYPWGAEALERAQREGKPILLSIGYSACHWCHVMAHESFEDPEIARLMNDLYVSIKVDREERPDIDQIYQTSHALLTRRSGGWPLTMFLTPEGEPFFGGTYYPKHARYGSPGFVDLLPRIASAWRDQRTAIVAQNTRLREVLAELEPAPYGTGDSLPSAISSYAVKALEQSFDAEHGGFGSAPKFPHPTELELCLREYARHNDADALHIARHTLARMADGGIHDQLGGGFCRYSVDREWTIPHFEKMLYDNGPLLGLYADLARITGEARFAETARGIVGWLAREMRSDDGAFFSSLDADSEGEEGKFYVWSADEARALLSDEEWAVAAPYFGLDRPPNFESHAWHLRVCASLDDIAGRLGISLPDAQTRLQAARAALFAARSKRIRPGLDDKLLTSWNALTIGGLARASRALDEARWAELAASAIDTLRATAWRDGRLLATRKGDRAHLNAYLDDYAFLLAALLESMQTRFRLRDYEWALAIGDVLLAQFEDSAHGGFFFTSHDHERLIHRPKPGPDGATPSGNGVAAQALIALGHLANVPRYAEAGERAIRLFAAPMSQSPAGYSTLLAAVEDMRRPPTFVILTGDSAQGEEWQRKLERSYRPDVRVFNFAGIRDLPPALVKGVVEGPGAAAWICRGTHCLPPIRALDQVEQALQRQD